MNSDYRKRSTREKTDTENTFESDISISDVLALLWDGRFAILASLLITLGLGVYYVWRATPIYSMDAMLQIEEKKQGSAISKVLAVEGFFDIGSPALAEAEIIKSNLVLGRVVELLGLDVVATPELEYFIGRGLARNSKTNPSLDVAEFVIPQYMTGMRFSVRITGEDEFELFDDAGKSLGRSRAGKPLLSSIGKDALGLTVQNLEGRIGQEFSLSRVHGAVAIEYLRENLKVVEKGKQTNILSLSFEHHDPIRGARILNKILQEYVKQNIDRRVEEKEKTMGFLREQLPIVRGKLDIAESVLNSYRQRNRSVDLSAEGQLMLQQSVQLESQVVALNQKKEESLRRFQPDNPEIKTIEQQVKKLVNELSEVNKKVQTLPSVQQEFIRLSREVQVNQELYTGLLNTSQQLQVAKAGEVGNVRIVDHATPSIKPVKPKRNVLILVSGIIGFIVGIALTIIRKSLNKGVEDSRQIESNLGVPVIATIPHSPNQDGITKAIRREEGGLHLLAVDKTDDLAVESLRSLRTALSFSRVDSNKIILFSGPSPGIGKSFVSSNFAAVLAIGGAKVLIVDGDLRKGSLHKYFGLESRKDGLSEILSGQREWKKTVRNCMENLDVICTGVLPPNPSELLMSKRMSEFVEGIQSEYDLIVFDAPPILAVTDAAILAKHAGSVLLLVKAAQNPLDEISAAIKRFEASDTKVNGCVFNDVRELKIGYKYYRYSYHYQYK